MLGKGAGPFYACVLHLSADEVFGGRSYPATNIPVWFGGVADPSLVGLCHRRIS